MPIPAYSSAEDEPLNEGRILQEPRSCLSGTTTVKRALPTPTPLGDERYSFLANAL